MGELDVARSLYHPLVVVPEANKPLQFPRNPGGGGGGIGGGGRGGGGGEGEIRLTALAAST
jgi:hypothetical protein